MQTTQLNTLFPGEIIHCYGFLIQIGKSVCIQIQNLCGLKCLRFVHNSIWEFWFICQKVVVLFRDTCYLAPSFLFLKSALSSESWRH